MNNWEAFEAARWYIDSMLSLQEELEEKSISVSEPIDEWYIVILRESNRLYHFAKSVGYQSRQIYSDDIKARTETHGRLIDIANPVRLSGGVIEIASILEEAESRLREFEQTLNLCQENADFNTEGYYRRTATSALSIGRKIVKQTRLYLHTHLWMLWTLESLSQTDQIYGLMTRSDHFDKISENAFAYVAHPPIVVATMACTAMIEEVGAAYINQFVPKKSLNTDNTNCSEVLKLIDVHFPQSSEFDIDGIEGMIVSARNDISHYIIKRQGAVSTEGLEQYFDLSSECLRLVGILVDKLLFHHIQKYEERVLRAAIVS